MTGPTTLTHRPYPHDATAREYFHHSSAQRIATDVVIVESLRQQYPELKLTIVPTDACSLLSYAASGHATATPLEDPNDPYSASLKWRRYVPPARRLDSGTGALVNQVFFAKYMYRWREHEFTVYVVSCRDGSGSYPEVNQYVLSGSEAHTDDLILHAARWSTELHDEVWVFDAGWWRKSGELWRSVQDSSWDDVILDHDMKSAIINDVEGFFKAREQYKKLKVPWKRGIIYYGPPGNGKTISIKAMMHSLYKKGDPIPTLYVRSLASYGGPEYAISQIFAKARQEAPCYLVFEDLDSIVSDSVRSYFLNEVDGLRSNDGILMVGSTNHLDRLDPGIAKRPSRFDRKYFFPNPNEDQRVQYCKYWQRKLADNKDVEFPDKMCGAIARITDGFSFAYMQEAFVAALLAIARQSDDGDKDDDSSDVAESVVEMSGSTEMKTLYAQGPFSVARVEDDELEKLVLWREIKKQIKILREEIGEKR